MKFILVRLAVFVVSLAAVDLAAQVLPHYALVKGLGLSKNWGLGVSNLLVGPLVFVAYRALVTKFEQRRPVELGADRAGPELMAGVAFGLVLIGGTYAVLLGLGVARWEGYASASGLGLALAINLGASVGEEIILRGVVFRLTEEAFGSAIALAFSAVLFGFLHATNSGATAVSTLAIVLESGTLCALAFSATRRLWLPIGLHFGWGIGEGGLFDAAVSGGKFYHGLFRVPLRGSDILTGGTFGPEASVVAMAACMAASAALAILIKRRGTWRVWRVRMR